jgi:hypothetical protein
MGLSHLKKTELHAYRNGCEHLGELDTDGGYYEVKKDIMYVGQVWFITESVE